MIKAFYLGNINAGQARGVITLALGAQRQVQALEQGAGGPGGGGGGGNVILVKATPQELQVVQQVLEMVDKNKNEVVLDVDIYEVSHDSMLKIGNQIATSPVQVDAIEYIDKETGKPYYRQTPTSSLGNFGGLGQANALAGTGQSIGWRRQFSRYGRADWFAANNLVSAAIKGQFEVIEQDANSRPRRPVKYNQGWQKRASAAGHAIWL